MISYDNEYSVEFKTMFRKLQESLPLVEKKKQVKDRSGRVMYSYAEFDTVLETYLPVIRSHNFVYTSHTIKNDTVIFQDPSVIYAGDQETRLTFIDTNEAISTFVPLFIRSYTVRSDNGARQDNNLMQGLGSAITFARRYGLFDILGIAADVDDDGKGTAPPEHNRQATKPAQKPVAQPTLSDDEVADMIQTVHQLFEMKREEAYADDEIRAGKIENYLADNFAGLTPIQLINLLTKVKEWLSNI